MLRLAQVTQASPKKVQQVEERRPVAAVNERQRVVVRIKLTKSSPAVLVNNTLQRKPVIVRPIARMAPMTSKDYARMENEKRRLNRKRAILSMDAESETVYTPTMRRKADGFGDSKKDSFSRFHELDQILRAQRKNKKRSKHSE